MNANVLAEFRAGIVFCSMVGATARLDCIGTTPDVGPVTLVVDIPAGVEWAELAARALAQWTVSGSELDVRVRQGRDRRQVRIVGERHVLRLDLREVITKNAS